MFLPGFNSLQMHASCSSHALRSLLESNLVQYVNLGSSSRAFEYLFSSVVTTLVAIKKMFANNPRLMCTHDHRYFDVSLNKRRPGDSFRSTANRKQL